jgi:hypothetical protein
MQPPTTSDARLSRTCKRDTKMCFGMMFPVGCGWRSCERSLAVLAPAFVTHQPIRRAASLVHGKPGPTDVALVRKRRNEHWRQTMRSTFALFLTGTAALFTTNGNLAAQTDPHPPEITCADAADEWKEGAGYKAGDAVISYGGFLWVCKAGPTAALCDDAGYEPDRNKRATEAWEIHKDLTIDDTRCRQVAAPDLIVDEVAVSGASCRGTIAVLQLTATVRNNNPFGGSTTVAFYRGSGDNKIKFAVEPIAFEDENYDPVFVSTTWSLSSVGSEPITVVADDDGKGRDRYFELNADDNSKTVTIPTCPMPKPPGPPIQP